jgi:HD-GYP domain-containing protein (c-di-GMP phosphodiesterase class II)
VVGDGTHLGKLAHAVNGQSLRHATVPYIAIVIGNPRQRSRVAGCLKSFYRYVEYSDLSDATAGCRAHAPLLAVVSETLTTGSGFDFIRMLRLDPNIATVPIVMVIAEDDKSTRQAVAQCGAQALLVEPYSRSALVTAVSALLNRHTEQRWQTLHPLPRQALTGTLELFNGVASLIGNGEPIPYRAVSDACEPVVDAIARNDFKGILNGVRDHDNYSFAHSLRVATYLALFGFNLGLSRDEQVLLASGGLLHDVGKMTIPHEVLNKPGRLSAAEFEIMKGHVTASIAYLGGCQDLPKGIVTIAAQHHEKLDGTGYPEGLAGKALNRLARMASIIDVFSALTDRRPYKPRMEAEVALNLMVNEMASHLDIRLLGLFRQMLLDAGREMPAPVRYQVVKK